MPVAVWQDVVLLLRLRLRQAMNSTRFASRPQKIIGGTLAASAFLLAGALFVASDWLFTGAARTTPKLVQPLADRTVYYLFLFLLAGGLPFVSGALLTPGDLHLLNGSPIRPGALVLARLVDGIIASSAQFIVLGGPLLLASAKVYGAGAGGWLLMPLILLLFLSLPALVLSLLILGLARLIGVRRIRVAVALASVLVSIGLCLVGISEASHRAEGGLKILTSALPDTLPPVPNLLPSSWVSFAWRAVAAGQWDHVWGWLALLLGLAALLTLACVFVGVPVLTGESLLEGEDAARRVRPGTARIRLPFSAPVRALLEKDARYVVRDLVLLSQLGVPLILYAVPWLISGQVSENTKGDLFALSLGIVATVAYMETSILGLSSIGLEGQGFWHLLSAPIRMGSVIFAKWLGAWAGSLVLTLPALGLSCLLFNAGLNTLLAASGVCIVACAALSGIAVGISGLFPRFVYDNPAHRASLAALVWGFVAATGYALLVGLLLGGGWYLSTQQANATAWGWAAGLFVALSLVSGLLPLLAARARLEGYVIE